MTRIYLIDGNNFIYRMFFALPEFKTKDGEIVNALFGMAKFFANTLPSLNPDYIVFIKDTKGENFRHQLYPEYKATRDKMPDNLRTQIPLIEEMINKMNIPLVEIEGCEADDVIGTLSVILGEDKNNQIEILSGDKDLYSLVSPNIKIYDTMKKKKFGPKETQERFGIHPSKIIDYLAIIGDKSDNIPGIDGFGPNKAVGLINNIGGVEQIYNEVSKVLNGEKKLENYPKEIQGVFKGKTFEKLILGQEMAFLSKKLATIKKDVDLPDFNLENYKFDITKIINQNIINFFEKYEFNSLVSEEGFTKQKTYQDIGLKIHIIDNDTDLEKLLNTIKGEKELVLDTETTSLDSIEAELVGISIFLDEKRIYYINRLHTGNKVSDKRLKEFIKYILNSDKKIIGHNLKYDLEILTIYLANISTTHTNSPQTSSNTSSQQTSFDF